MDDTEDDAVDAAIQIVCPHCGAVEHDDLEVLLSDCLTSMHCRSCTTEFLVLIAECRGCGQEAVQTWLEKPLSMKSVQSHLCLSCRSSLQSHDAREQARRHAA